MSPRRPPHSKAHAPCPYGQTNWSDCDTAYAHRFGQCKATVGDREPEPCSRWAADEEGWCAQHFIALKEKAVKKAREAERQLQLMARIDAFIEMTKENPSIWDRGVRLATQAESTRGLAGVAGGAGLEPAVTRVTTEGPTTERPAKGPYRTPVRKPPYKVDPASLD